MKFNEKIAKAMLTRGAVPIPQNISTNELFVLLVNARFNYDLDDDIEEEIWEWIFEDDNAQFEVKDFTYCITEYQRELMVHFSFITDPSWDQHVDVLDLPKYLQSASEQSFYVQKKIKPTTNMKVVEWRVHIDLKTLGATRDDTLLTNYQ